MFSNLGDTSLGGVVVHTTSGRGFTPEEIAERAMDKIMSVGDQAPPAIRDQALAYRETIHRVLVKYMRDVVRSHNTTIANRLIAAGHPELVSLLGE